MTIVTAFVDVVAVTLGEYMQKTDIPDQTGQRGRDLDSKLTKQQIVLDVLQSICNEFEQNFCRISVSLNNKYLMESKV